jgi:hypothetical protein
MRRLFVSRLCSLTRHDGLILRAKSWNMMPADVQLHWRTLGWSPSSWHDMAKPPLSSDKDFADLSAVESTAALALGYSEDSWNNDSDSPFGDAQQLELQDAPWWLRHAAFKTTRWTLLNAQDRARWAELGWTEARWDSDGLLPPPPSTFRDFDQLRSHEQQVVLDLGYTGQVTSCGRIH